MHVEDYADFKEMAGTLDKFRDTMFDAAINGEVTAKEIHKLNSYIHFLNSKLLVMKRRNKI